MTSRVGDINYGIQQSGGTINGPIAVGARSRARVDAAPAAPSGSERDAILSRLDAVLEAMRDHASKLPDEPKAEKLLDQARAEAAKKRPDTSCLHAFLRDLADNVKSVSVIAKALAPLVSLVSTLI